MGPVDPSAKNPGKNTVPGALWHILYMDLIFKLGPIMIQLYRNVHFEDWCFEVHVPFHLTSLLSALVLHQNQDQNCE